MTRPAIRYFVNSETRMCGVLHVEREKDVAQAQACGFVEVDEAGLDAFRAETFATIEAGWNPAGRTTYKKFIENRNKS